MNLLVAVFNSVICCAIWICTGISIVVIEECICKGTRKKKNIVIVRKGNSLFFNTVAHSLNFIMGP